MDARNAVVLFEDVPVRKEWYNDEQWIPAIDVAKALGYDNPSRATSDVLRRNTDRFEGYSTIRKLRISVGGVERGRNTVWLNLVGVVAFCMLSNMPSAIPFQRWADKVLAKKLQELPTDIRLIAKQKRVKFTDILKEHGCTAPKQYSTITIDMKEALDIDKYKPKAECDLIEVMKIAASEDIARINMIQNNAQGYIPCRDESTKAAHTVRIGTQKTGETCKKLNT
jgi:prophage antirepressor-like protein